MTDSEKKLIIDILENHNPYLYLGAGFSRGALNNDGIGIPLGDELKKRILTRISCEDEELTNEISNKSLPEICQELKDLDETIYINTIIEALKGYRPTEKQSYITEYSWHSIFTVNIDDLVEQVYENKNKPLQIFVGKKHSERIKESEQKLFKLHGSVRNPGAGIVFSTSEYSDLISDLQDFNLKNLIIAFESNDFFVVGTELIEREIEYFISIYKKRNTDLIQYNVIFINPYPSTSLRRKIQKNPNFRLIEISSDEFFEFIHNIKNYIKKNYYDFKSLVKRCNFRTYEQIKEEFYNNENKPSYDTALYFGSEPEWEDLLYGYIINYSGISKFYKSIIDSSSRINILYGPLYSGKSSALKQIFYLLSTNSDYLCLFSFDNCINIDNIRKIIKNLTKTVNKIFLFYDDIGEYYSLFSDLLEIDDRLIIIGTASLMIHNRKRYSLLADNNTNEFAIQENLDIDDIELIRQKFIEKGLAGEHILKTEKEWRNIINVNESIVTAMYAVTQSRKFQSYYDQIFIEEKITEQSKYKLLLICSFCYILNIPYIKQYMLSQLNLPFVKDELQKFGDYIKIMQDGSIRIRTKYIADSIFSLSDNKELIVDLIIKICISISSLIKNSGRDYNKNVYEYLTKYKYLSKILHLSNTQIQEIYKKIQSYYTDISYFWLQLGISEQHGGNYNYALQHFKTALSINPNSYGVKHAIARNYCKQALELDSNAQARETFEIGKKQFIELISLKEFTRSKSYSIHSLVYEIMEFHKKYNIELCQEDIKICIDLLNDSKRKDTNDNVMSKLQMQFYNFLNKNNTFSEQIYEIYENELDY